MTNGVLSLEILGKKFPEKNSSLSRNFRKFVNHRCQSAVYKFGIAKWCCKQQTSLQVFIR